MRICMTVLNNFRHDARVRREARALASAGHEVLVLALEAPDLPDRESMAGFDVRRIPIRSRSLPNCGPVRLIQYLEHLIRTLLAALAWRADVYHAHNANTLLIARLAAGLRRARLVYDAHELETERNWGSSNLSPLVRRLWTLPERLFIQRADAVITVCDSIADQLERSYAVEPPWVLRNMPRHQGFSRSVDVRAQIGLEQDKSLVLYQGGIKANRGIEQMIEAMTLLDEAVLVLLGAGPMLEPMRAQVDERSLTDRVFFLGHIALANLPAYTASADLGLALIQNACLSYYYSLPNKLFEYIHAGLPVVISDFPEMARVVRKYELGELVDPSDPVEIAAAIQRILADPDYYRLLQENAAKASAVLSWDREARKLVRLYRTLEP